MEAQSAGHPPPPRSHSLRISEQSLAAGAHPLAVAFDFQGDGNDDKTLSTKLVAQAKEALQRVEDGWSPNELRPVVTELVNRVEKLVRSVFFKVMRS